MLALSQSTTERLLEESLNAAGGKLERGIKMISCRPDADRVEMLSRMISAESTLLKFLRGLLPAAAHLATVRARIRETVTGLDHDLPKLPC